MENEDVIREEMEDTRTSLTKKIETLETQVAGTVQGATSNVAETVEAVKDTVETVKETVQETVATVRESVEETISTVKETVQDSITAVKGMFDIPAMVDAHPWLMFGGAIGVGFALERLLVKPAAHRRGFLGAASEPMFPAHYSGEDLASSPSSSRRPLAGLMKTFEPEINRLKGFAVGALLGSVRDAVANIVPEHMAPKLREVIDSVTQKLGGETFQQRGTTDDGSQEHFGNGRRQQEPTFMG
jgi:ElaB/YqjD/DUF883 family membrane-anchored ribosome-binding protein